VRVILAFITCVLIWGSTWYAIEWQLGHVSKEWSLTYRFVIAAVTIFLWCKFKGHSLSFGRDAHFRMAAAGFLFFSFNYFFVYWGTEYLTSGLVAVSFSLMAFFNILNGRLFLKTKIETRAMAASLIGVTGLVFIFLPELQGLDGSGNTPFGIMLCVFATIIASLGNTVIGSDKARAIPVIPFNTWGMAYGALFNLSFALIQGDPPSLDPRPEYYVALLALSIFGTVIAFSFYVWLIGQLGTARTAYIAVMTPLVALTISTLYEGYSWTVYAAAGVAMVIGGNILMIKSKKSA